jgi:hypothetical protein
MLVDIVYLYINICNGSPNGTLVLQVSPGCPMSYAKVTIRQIKCFAKNEMAFQDQT